MSRIDIRLFRKRMEYCSNRLFKLLGIFSREVIEA